MKFTGRSTNSLFNTQGAVIGTLTVSNEFYGTNTEIVGRIPNKTVLDQLLRIAMDENVMGFQLVPILREKASDG